MIDAGARGSTMHQRLNVTLPEGTVRLIDRLAKKGGRSRLINEAIRHFAEARGRVALRKELREGALARSERDRVLSDDWFVFEEEPWRSRR